MSGSIDLADYLNGFKRVPYELATGLVLVREATMYVIVWNSKTSQWDASWYFGPIRYVTPSRGVLADPYRSREGMQLYINQYWDVVAIPTTAEDVLQWLTEMSM